jgi:myosin heavy subunit
LKFVNDTKKFDVMRKALEVLGFKDKLRVSLHLWQYSFESDSGDEGTVMSIAGATWLLGVPRSDLVTIRIIVARNEQYEKKLTPTQVKAQYLTRGKQWWYLRLRVLQVQLFRAALHQLH